MAQTPEKDLEIPGVAGMRMIAICMLKQEDMKMRSHGTKILVLITMILATKHMAANQEAKVMDLVRAKIEIVVLREGAAEVVVALGEDRWEEVMLRNEELTQTIYPTRKNHFLVTVSPAFYYSYLDLIIFKNICFSILYEISSITIIDGNNIIRDSGEFDFNLQ